MTQFSANLGFLWTDLPLPDAIRAAKAAGFDAVECHWPYATDPALIKAALDETGLPMLGLNTNRGDVSNGQNGLSTLPDQVDDARAAIDQSVSYAVAIGAGAIHVMAGVTDAEGAHDTFVQNLTYACAQAARHQITILIEPLNPFDAPGYFLRTTVQAAKIIADVGTANLKLMFDCYHVARTENDVLARLDAVYPLIGHIQFASVPDRGRPDQGQLNYPSIFDRIAQLGWTAPLGAEYKPGGSTEDTLGWMDAFRS